MNNFCWLWESNCRFVMDSGWAQAILSFIAIGFASLIATKQASSQHATAMKQVHEQHMLSQISAEIQQKEHRVAVAEALSIRVSHAIGVINNIRNDVKRAADENTRLTPHQRMLYRESLLDIERDIAGISIFELPVPQMVHEFVFMKTAIKQVLFNFEGLLQEKVNYDKHLVRNFDPHMETAVEFLADFYSSLEAHKD